MKDRQVTSAGPQPRIPVISGILHWLAMPAIVLLRSRFGFAYLSPKSMFLACGWAATLFFIYAVVQPGAWLRFWAVASFAFGASVLYVIHLVSAFRRELDRKGNHDHFSGSSHLLRLPGLQDLRGREKPETMIHLWLEPFLVFVAAAVLRAFFREQLLSSWLLIVALAFWLKEFFNYWYLLRSDKKQEDIMDDAEEKMPSMPGSADVPLPNAAGRKAKVKRAPAPAQTVEQTEMEHRHAEVLRLMPPYSLEQAEANYRALSKITHPDATLQSAGSTERMAELNAAIEHFRRSKSHE